MPAATSKELRERKGELGTKIRELAELANSEGRDFTAEEAENWAKVNADFDATNRDLERVTRVEAITEDLERAVPQPEGRNLPGRGNTQHKPDPDGDAPETRDQGPSEEDRALSLQAWFRVGIDKELEPRHQLACRKVGVNPRAQSYEFKLRRDYGAVRSEHRAQSINFPNLGGYTVPEGFIPNLERAMLAFGGTRNVADVMRTTSGEAMTWPTTDDTSNEGSLLNENTSIGNDLDVNFGAVIFYAHKYSSRLVRVPTELLEDSAFNLASEVGSMLGERLGRITNRHFTVGDGAAKPWGIVTRATTGVTTAAATAITADEIVRLVHSVDPSYRTSAGFMMHDGILLQVRLLKDGNGQYMWQAGLQAGVPDRLAGYPVTVNQHMQATLATATRTMIFGQLSKYKIRDVAGVRLMRLNERYADNDQVGFVAFSRHDGNLLNAGTNPVVALLQA